MVIQTANLQPYLELKMETEISVYPGAYRSMHTYPKKIRLKAHPSDELFLHDGHFSNELNGYVCEIPLPGCSKDQIQLHTQKQLLHILFRHPTGDANGKVEQVRIHLSEKADHAFITAYFQNGVLYVFIPETDHPVTADNDHIVVY
jgi:HSP20 family molecular chaperone IbpA